MKKIPTNLMLSLLLLLTSSINTMQLQTPTSPKSSMIRRTTSTASCSELAAPSEQESEISKCLQDGLELGFEIAHLDAQPFTREKHDALYALRQQIYKLDKLLDQLLGIPTNNPAFYQNDAQVDALHQKLLTTLPKIIRITFQLPQNTQIPQAVSHPNTGTRMQSIVGFLINHGHCKKEDYPEKSTTPPCNK